MNNDKEYDIELTFTLGDKEHKVLNGHYGEQEMNAALYELAMSIRQCINHAVSEADEKVVSNGFVQIKKH